jgi:transposase
VKCGAKRRDVVRARRDVIFIAMKKLGYSGAEVARHLGVSTSCVNRNIARCDLSPIGKKVIGLLE